MNFRTLLFLIGLLLSTQTFSQANQHFTAGFESNSQYYMDDTVTGDFKEDNRFRSNNYLKIDYGIGDLSFGVQLEGYAPQSLLSYSPKYDAPFNFGTYSVSYSRDKWEATLGHFYEQFGSGLILRSWEDRQLGINNAIRGARISLRPTDRINMTALYGNQRDGFNLSEGQLFGFGTNFDFSSTTNSLQVGLNYVGRYQAIASDTSDFSPTTHAMSGSLQYAKNSFYTNIEGVIKDKDAFVINDVVYDKNLFYGNSISLEVGYSQKGIGINTTFRRLENMNFYTDREAAGNTYNEQIVNYIPGLTKQHDYALSNIYVYQAQSGISFDASQPSRQKMGEIGGQMDIYYKFKKNSTLGGRYGTKIAANISNWYGLDAAYNAEYRRASVNNFFGFGGLYFSDYNIEIRKKITKEFSSIFMFSNLTYNQNIIESKHNYVKTNVLVADLTYKLSKKQSIRVDTQHLWTKDDKKNWAAGTIELNANTHWSFFVTDMYNYGNEDENHKNHYYNVGGSYTKSKSRLALSYGRQRGGLLCVGGVCREVPEATGLTFNITTSF